MQAQTVEAAGPGEIRAFMAAHGFVSCDSLADIKALHALALRLIPGPIASISVMACAQRITQQSLFLRRHEAEALAFIACLPLTEAGEDAIRSGRFNGLRVAAQWIGPFGQATRAGYIWGLGGVDRGSAFSAMRALRIMRERFFAHIDLYARATTPAGRSLMQGFGYRHFDGLDATMLRAPGSPRRALASAS